MSAIQKQRAVILQAAILSEAILVVVSYILASIFDIQVIGSLSLRILFIGLLVAVPMVSLNILVSRIIDNNEKYFKTFHHFLRHVIEPICSHLTFLQITLISLVSGFAEELFFRGVLNQLLASWIGLWPALIIGSLAFAVVHFLGHIKEYLSLVPYYFLFGFYLAIVTNYFGDITPAIIAHTLNNFIVMLIVRREVEIKRLKRKAV